MRSALSLLGVLFLAGTASLIACSTSSEEESEADEANLTDSELGTKALQILGATQVPRVEGDPPACSSCHSINPVSIRKWKKKLDEANTYLGAEHTAEQKVNYFRNDPDDSRSEFSPSRVGMMTAGMHLALGANVSETRHPKAFKQGKMLDGIFKNQRDLYNELRTKLLMPVSADYPRLTPQQYELILTWFEKGLPKLDELLPDTGRPTSCTDDFTKLAQHAKDIKTKSWAATNKANRVAMLGCAASGEGSPVECLKNKTADGKDVFASSADTDFGKTWALEGSTVRVLRALSSPNSFWLRSSADGRYASTGGGGGGQAVDLQGNIDGTPRDVKLSGVQYDPDFFPDNKAFMFQGGAKFCSQKVLDRVNNVTFNEPECTRLTGDGHSALYQTVGQTIGDNSIGDRFILYGNQHANDPGTSIGEDTSATAGPDSTIQIFTAIALGNDAEEGYQTLDDHPERISLPYKGDTMMTRSGTVISSRFGNAQGVPFGYAIDKLNKQRFNNKYLFTTEPMGTVCMAGNKANFSFDERFLATHHYTNASDRGPEDVGFENNGSADIYAADFITKEKKRLTKMGPNQFALFPHFRSDGWLYFLVVDKTARKYYVVASDWAVRQLDAHPTP
jgi:hypothetical protein